MSTYDWIDLHRGPCECGGGQFIAQFGTPDHPWPTKSRDWKLEIECEACKRDYALMRDGEVIRVVKRTDVQAHQGGPIPGRELCKA